MVNPEPPLTHCFPPSVRRDAKKPKIFFDDFLLVSLSVFDHDVVVVVEDGSKIQCGVLVLYCSCRNDKGS